MEGLGYFLIFCWVATVILTIVLAVKKGYSGFLAFLLGLFIPLLGSLLIIALLPDKYELGTARTSYRGNSSGINFSEVSPISQKVNSGEFWVCKECDEKNPIASLMCKSCGAYK